MFVISSIILSFSAVVNCHLVFNNGGNFMRNNSYIYYVNIADGDNALKCVTNDLNCCTDINWNDETGTVVHEGSDNYGSLLGSSIAIYHCSHFHSGSMISYHCNWKFPEIFILLTALPRPE